MDYGKSPANHQIATLVVRLANRIIVEAEIAFFFSILNSVKMIHPTRNPQNSATKTDTIQCSDVELEGGGKSPVNTQIVTPAMRLANTTIAETRTAFLSPIPNSDKTNIPTKNAKDSAITTDTIQLSGTGLPGGKGIGLAIANDTVKPENRINVTIIPKIIFFSNSLLPFLNYTFYPNKQLYTIKRFIQLKI